MRIVFMGTPEYALTSLQALAENGCEVVGVFTQPDKPRGRGGRVSMSPVKEYAQGLGIPVYQPRRIRSEGLEDLKKLSPDVCVTAAFGQILSQDILDVPPLGTINVHASLLPEYRGSAPVNWAIMKGERVTGVTTMMTDKGIDTGDILLARSTLIDPDETAQQLTKRLADIGAELLLDTLTRIRQGNCPRQQQDESKMSYYPLLTRSTGAMDWSKPARELHNQVRGLFPWPTAYSASPWGSLKVLETSVEDWVGKETPGTLLRADPKTGMLVAAGEGALRILKLQAPGGKAMAPEDFLRGHPLPEGGRMENGETA